MYIPYVRGKQFELLALKEYSADLGASGQVSPLIEPVKDPHTSGSMERCLASLLGAGVTPIVALNPLVGDLAGDLNLVSHFLSNFDAEERTAAAILVHQDSTPEAVAALASSVSSTRPLWLCHVSKNAQLGAIGESLERHDVSHIIPADARPRQFRSAFGAVPMGILADRFPNQLRNVDYLPIAASEFSDDVLFYLEEGFVAFGDYLTVGSGWTDGGFTPRAVAIHWTYQEVAGGPIMIRHFVSTSNEDISNVGGKYLEAASKLVAFLSTVPLQTKAGAVVRETVEASTYPGLGIVKKLSMQNHLEVMMKALQSQ